MAYVVTPGEIYWLIYSFIKLKGKFEKVVTDTVSCNIAHAKKRTSESTKSLVGTFLRKLIIMKFNESLEFISEVSCNFPFPFLINFAFFSNKEFVQEELNQVYILFISGYLTSAIKAF